MPEEKSSSPSSRSGEPTKRTARIAGLLYLVCSGPAVLPLMYIPKKLIVPGDAAATAGRVVANETLLRIGMVCEVGTAIAFLFVVRALYRLLAGVDTRHASLMVTLFALSIPISCLNVVNEIAALTLFRGADFLSVFRQPERDALGFLFLRMHGRGVDAAAIFWGLWLIPFGILVMRSGFIPRILGILLVVNGFAYPIATLTQFLLPAYAPAVKQWALIPETGELWIMLWLLVAGIRERAPASAAPN